MEIIHQRSQPATKGAAEHFTGDAYIGSRFRRDEPSRLTGGVVTFQPGARSAWHSHPLGQTLIVTEGTGWTQVAGGPRVEIGKGDIIWCPPGVRHWHGATATTPLTHITIQEALDGTNVIWAEKVTDAEYLAAPSQD